MRAIIYTRCSTSQQRTDSQLEVLKTFVSNSGYDLVKIIEDIGVSGTKLGFTRDGMKTMMGMVNRKEVDVICVYSVDRIGRKLTDILSIADHLNEKGVGLVIHKNGIDTTTTQGKHMLGFFALVAEMERDFIASRIADGMAAAKAKGKKFGRKCLSDEKQEKVRVLRQQGLSMNKIAKALGVGNSQVLRICKEMVAA